MMPFLSKINTIKGLEYDPIIRHEVSYQGPDRIAGVFSTFTHSWFACGAKLFVINHSDGSIQSSWTFGKKPDSVEITCAIELQFEGCSIPLLIVGVCSENTNKICYFNPNTRKIVRAIECNFPIRVLCIVEDGLNDVNPLNDALTYTQGLLAIGCADGSLYVVDLCRNLLLKALNGDFRFVSDEQNPAEVSLIDVTSVTPSGIQAKLKECYSNQSSLAVLLSEDCDDGVTALCYSFESAILYVGTSAGSFLLWNMTNLSCLFHSPSTSRAVISLSLLEPCDDPMHNLFLWVCYENHFHAVMYSISFSTKFFVPGYGVYYQGFESAGLVYKLVLGQNENLIVQRAINSLAIAKSIPKNLAKTFKISDSECTQLRLFVTALEVISDGVQEARAVVFDLNQWYKEQLPDEGLSSCVEVVELGTGGLCHLALDPASISHYQWVRPLEQHFHPSALDFRLWCIEDVGIRCLEKLGLQSQWLRNMSIVGPSALLSPQQIFHGAISAGLLPTFIDPPDPEFTTIEEERKYILTVCLENRATSVIEHCAQEWSTGSHPVAGCTLGFLIDWLWELHGSYKSQGNKMCVPLFDQSSLVFDASERKALQHCKSLLTTVQTLYTNIIRKYSNFVLIDGLEQKLAAMSLVKFYFDCCLKLISVNLLPEPSESGRPADSIVYKYNEINNFVCMKRKEGPFLGDSLISRNGAEKEWEEEGGTGRYPPPSIQSVLRYCLHPAPTFSNKLSLMLYLYTDIINSHTPLRDQGNMDKVKNFQYLLRIPDVQYKTVIAFWYLDHNLFYEGTSLLFDPRILPVDISGEQHRSILRLLLLQGQEKLSLQYLRLKASDLHELDDFRLELDLLLSNRLINEAFMFQRKHPEYREELLIQFFQGCIEKGLLGQVFGLHLDSKEEAVLFKFLKSSDLKNKNDLQVLLLLSRAKYTEAVSLNDRINSTINGPKTRLETDTRDMIVRGITGGINNISKDLAQEMRLYRPPPPGTCPKPLSTLIKIRSEPDGPLLQTDSRFLLSAAAKSTRHLSDYVNFNESTSRKRGLDDDENMDVDDEYQPRKKPALWNSIIRNVVAPSTPLKSNHNQEREVMELVGTPLVKKRGKRISPHSKPSSILKATTPQRGQTIDDQSDTPTRKTLRFALPDSEKQIMSGRSLFGDLQSERGEQSGICKEKDPWSEHISGRKSLRSASIPDEAEKETNDTSTRMEAMRDRLKSSKNKLLGDGAVDWKNVAETSQPKVLFTPGSSKNPIKSALRRLTQPLAQTSLQSIKDPSLDITITPYEKKYLESPSREMDVSPLTEAILTTTLTKKLFPTDEDEEDNNANQESSLERYKRLRSQGMLNVIKTQVNENEDRTCSKNEFIVKEKCLDDSEEISDEDEKLNPKLSAKNVDVSNKVDVCGQKLHPTLSPEEHNYDKSDQVTIIVQDVESNLEDDPIEHEDIKNDNRELIRDEDDEINQEDNKTSHEGSINQDDVNNENLKSEMEGSLPASTNQVELMGHISEVFSGLVEDMFPLNVGPDSGSPSEPNEESSNKTSPDKAEKKHKNVSYKDSDSDVICLSSDEENEEEKSTNENSNDSSSSYSSQEYDAEPQTGLYIEINSESECDEYSPNESEEDPLDDAEYVNDGDNLDENLLSGAIAGNSEDNFVGSVIADDSDSDAGSGSGIPSRISAEFYSPHELNEEGGGGIVIMEDVSDDERPYDLLTRHIPDPFLSDIVPIKVASKYEKKCEKSSLSRIDSKPDSSEIAEQSKHEIISIDDNESPKKLDKPGTSAEKSKPKSVETKNNDDPHVILETDENSTKKLNKVESSTSQNISECIIPVIEKEHPNELNQQEASTSQNKLEVILPFEENCSKTSKKAESSVTQNIPELILPSKENESVSKLKESEAPISHNKSGEISLIKENSSKKVNKVESSATQNIPKLIPPTDKCESPSELNKLESFVDENEPEVIPPPEENSPRKLNTTDISILQNVTEIILPFSKNESPKKITESEVLTSETKINESGSLIQPSIQSEASINVVLQKDEDISISGTAEANLSRSKEQSNIKSSTIGTVGVLEQHALGDEIKNIFKSSKDDIEISQNAIEKTNHEKEELGDDSNKTILQEIVQTKISSTSSDCILKQDEIDDKGLERNLRSQPNDLLSKENIEKGVPLDVREANNGMKERNPSVEQVDAFPNEVVTIVDSNITSLQMEVVSSTSENIMDLYTKESISLPTIIKQEVNVLIPKPSETLQCKENVKSDDVIVIQDNKQIATSPIKEDPSCSVQTLESLPSHVSENNQSHQLMTDIVVSNTAVSDCPERTEPSCPRNEFEPSLPANDELLNQNPSDALDVKQITNDDMSHSGVSSLSSSMPLDAKKNTNENSTSVSSSEKNSAEQTKIASQEVGLKSIKDNICIPTKNADISSKTETKEEVVSSTSKTQSIEAENTCENSTSLESKAPITLEEMPKDISSNKQPKSSNISTECSAKLDVAADGQIQIKPFFFGRDEKNETYLRTTERVTFQVGSRVSLPSEDEPVDPLETAMIEEVEEEYTPIEENDALAGENEETDPRNTGMLNVDLSLHLSEDDLIGKPGMVDKGVDPMNSYQSLKGKRSTRNVDNSKDTKVSIDIENSEVVKCERKKLPALLPIGSEKVHDEKGNGKNKLEKQSFGTQTSDSFFLNKDDNKITLDSSKLSGSNKTTKMGLMGASKIVTKNELPDLKLDTNSNDKRERRSRRSSMSSQVSSNDKEGELKGILIKSSKVSQLNIEENQEYIVKELEVNIETNKEVQLEGGSEASKDTRISRRRRSSVSSQSSEVVQDLKTRFEEFSEVSEPSKETELRGILKKGKSKKKINDVEENLDKFSKRQTNLSGDELAIKAKSSRVDTSGNDTDNVKILERRRSARHSMEPELHGILKNKTEVKRRGSCTSESATDLLKRLEEDFPEVKRRVRRYSEEPELPGILKKTEGHRNRGRKSLSTNEISCESKTKFEEELDRLKKNVNESDITRKCKAGSSHYSDQVSSKEKDSRRSRRLSEEPQIHGILKNKAETKHSSITSEVTSDLTGQLNNDLPVNRRRRRHSVDAQSLNIKPDIERKTRRYSQVADDISDDYDGVKQRLRSYSEEPEIRGILKNTKKRKSSSHTFETNRDFKLRLEEDFPEEKKSRRHSLGSDLGAKDTERPIKPSRRHSCVSDEGSVKVKQKENNLSTEVRIQPEQDSLTGKVMKHLDDDRYLTMERVPESTDSPKEKKGRTRRKSASEEPVEVRRSLRQTTPDNKYKSPNHDTKRKLTSHKDSLVSKILEFSEQDSPVISKKSKSLQDFPIRRSTRLHPILENIHEEDEETPIKKKRKSLDDLEAQKVNAGAKSSKIKEEKRFPNLVIVNSDEDDDNDNDTHGNDNWTENYAKERRLTRTQKKVLMRNTPLMEGLSPLPLTPSTPESSTPKKSRRRPSLGESPSKTPTRTSLRLQRKPPSEAE